MERIDCDVFMKDGTALDLVEKVVCITGNFYGGNDCYVSTAIIAGGDVIFEDYADTVGIYADGRVSIGRFSKTGSISSGKDVVLDDYSCANHIFADGDVLLGYDACTVSVIAKGGIVSYEHPGTKTSNITLLDKIANFLFK